MPNKNMDKNSQDPNTKDSSIDESDFTEEDIEVADKMAEEAVESLGETIKKAPSQND
jgi:hypothetical protein